tara:strand:- start:3942 stop:4586 length:645 start_codon:yes stop_codon:yes gene_type:complete
MNKQKKFKLTIEDNYLTEVNFNSDTLIKKYILIMRQYLIYCFNNISGRKDSIIIAGMDMITNIYRIMIYYTKNLDLTVYHSNNSIYYFIEYMSQITDTEDNIFFNLTIKDAIMYVYNRSLFDINKKFFKKSKNIDIFKKTEVINDLLAIIKNINYTYNGNEDLERKKLELVFEKLTKIELKNDNITVLLDNHLLESKNIDDTIIILDNLIKKDI